jgi:hypothetical protein
MAWDGSGQYLLNPLYTPEVNGNVVDAPRYNGALADIAAGITFCLAKNGENVPTANLPMSGYKHTGVGEATAAGEYVEFSQVESLIADAIALLANSFIGLSDTPGSYTGFAYRPLRVNAGASGLEFGPAGGIRIVNVTASRDLLASDFGALLVCDSGSAITLTLPPFSTLAVPEESSLAIVQWGAGQVTLAAGSGVTLYSAGALVKTRTQFSQITLIKTGEDVALLGGDLA